jgi:hypothetical protein
LKARAQLTPRDFYVDARSGNDANPGTAPAPFATVSRAVTVVAARQAPARILIRPGTYREAISLAGFNCSSHTLILEGTAPGQVIISGSDIWNRGWKANSNGTYTHSWPYRWGFADDPWGDIGKLGRRREMVFINGTQLEQQLSPPLRKPGTFFVVDGSAITVYPPRGVELSHAAIEVAVRSGLLTTPNGIANLFVRNLIFEHDASAIGNGTGGAVDISKGVNVHLENCVARYNNWVGIVLQVVTHVRLTNVTADHNGEDGIGGYRIDDLVAHNLNTSWNNWRGYAGGFVGVDANGTKIVRGHGLRFNGFVASHNLTGGFWLDTDNRDVYVKNCSFSSNLTHGLTLENCQGPLTFVNCAMTYNDKNGIITNAVARLTVRNSVIFGNHGAQLMPCSTGPISVTDYQTHQKYSLLNRDWTLEKDRFGTVAPNGFVFGWCMSGGGWQAFKTGLKSDFNRWYAPHNPAPFAVARTTLALPGWQTKTGQDQHSAASPFQAPARSDGGAGVARSAKLRRKRDLSKGGGG